MSASTPVRCGSTRTSCSRRRSARQQTRATSGVPLAGSPNGQDSVTGTPTNSGTQRRRCSPVWECRSSRSPTCWDTPIFGRRLRSIAIGSPSPSTMPPHRCVTCSGGADSVTVPPSLIRPLARRSRLVNSLPPQGCSRSTCRTLSSTGACRRSAVYKAPRSSNVVRSRSYSGVASSPSEARSSSTARSTFPRRSHSSDDPRTRLFMIARVIGDGAMDVARSATLWDQSIPPLSQPA